MKHLAAAVLVALLAAPVAAESPRSGSFEIGTGPVLPDIDSDFQAPGPYEQVFGNKKRWQLSLGVGWMVYDGWGTVEVGFKTGWFRAKGSGLITTGGVTTESADPTTLNYVPTSAMVTYRGDLIYDRYHVPLVPYVRVALERYNWWITDGSSKWIEKGATNGYSGTVGLGFPLDVIDTTLSREMDRDWGVNSTYLYADVTWNKVDDFGASDSWDLSNHGPLYTFGLLMVY